MKKVSIIIFFISFLLYRPYVMQSNGMMYRGDDPSYLSYATSIAFLRFPSFDKELTNNPRHFIGSGILASPFVFLFSWIDRVAGSSIHKARTWDNVPGSWTQFGFVFSTLFYFWLSCFLLYRSLRMYFTPNISLITIFIMVIIQGVPLYVFRRPIFSHLYEFFLQSVMTYMAIHYNAMTEEETPDLYMPFFAGLIIGMVFLVRHNNLLGALIWPVAVWGIRQNRLVVARNWKYILNSYTVLFIPILLFFILAEFSNNAEYYQFAIDRIWNYSSKFLYFIKIGLSPRRLAHTLFGLDWGLLYTAPYIIISVLSLFYFKTGYKKVLTVAIIPVIIVNYLILVAANKTQGSWYGYRYFFLSAIPILVLPAAKFIEIAYEKYRTKLIVLLGVVSIFPLFSMLCFEGNPSNLTLHIGNGWPGGWINPTYQIEVWKTFLFTPIEFVKAVFKGGPLYIIYLISILLNKYHLLPEIVQQKYPKFDIIVFIKTTIIYVSPFLFYYTSQKFKSFWGNCNQQRPNSAWLT